MIIDRRVRVAFAVVVFLVTILVLRYAGLYDLAWWRVILIAYTFYATFEAWRRIWK